MELVKLTAFGDIPAQGHPVGLIRLSEPGGDRGLVFGLSDPDGIQTGKIPGYWTCPYDGDITQVYLTTLAGAFRVRFWVAPRPFIPNASDSINRRGLRATGHDEIFDLSDFFWTNITIGTTFAVEIVEVSSPAPTDISGSVVILQKPQN